MSAAVQHALPATAPRLRHVLPALRCVLTTAPLLLLGLSMAQSQSPAQAPPAAQSGPIQVTTDTQEYCDKLAERVRHDESAGPAQKQAVEELAEVNALASEGHHMCIHGSVRPGLARLRRALMLLEGGK